MFRGRLEQPAGLLRSLVIYYGNPLRLRQMKRFYQQFIREGDLCFDIGAHVGNRSWVWSGLGARVIAAEPQPYLAHWLRVAFAGRPDVTILQQALGSVPGSTTLYSGGVNATVSSLSPEWIDAVSREKQFAAVEWTPSYAVGVTTLDAMIDQYGVPVFCKLDVEGYEYEALLGLSVPLPAISFEFLPAAVSIARQCIDRLSQLGQYEFNWFLGETHRWEKARWITSEEMQAELSELAQGTRSGDIFARLRPPG